MQKMYSYVALLGWLLTFHAGAAQTIQKYENFKTKLLETLNSSRTTVQLEQTELTGFTRQQTLEYFEEILRKESDIQLIEPALAYYRYVHEESARTLLKELSAHPQFGDRALATLMENHPVSAISYLETLLKGPQALQYPYRKEAYRLLGKTQAPEAETLLLDLLSTESLYQETLLELLGQKAQHLPRLLPFLSIYPIPVLKAIRAFGTAMDDERAIPFLQHPQIAVKCLAIEIVARLGTAPSVALLMQQLQDPSWLIRRQIYTHLRSGKVAISFADILPYFYQDIPNQSVILELLLTFPEGKELATIQKLLDVQNPVLLRKAFLQLQHHSLTPPEAWLEFLFSHLDSPEVVLSVLPLLKSLPLATWLEKHPEQIQRLKQRLQTAPVLIQEEILYVLRKNQMNALRDDILSFLNHPSVLLQRSAIAVLGEWENPENLSILIEKMQEDPLPEELRDELALAILRIQKKR